ncbi:MAG: ABC transporter ATP-binding protein [Sandaracinaceae bacterium]|nr:ABC transporter ATP-binding protein [Sandaracinaceae bacterium]
MSEPSGEAPIVRVRDLQKTFRIGFFRRKVEAVRGLSFEVRRGEIFGLLGPNGAGKTTTIKMLLGLIFPMRGTMELFGREGLEPDQKARLGYLPENPYIYQYLKPLEFLDLCGRLAGMPARARGARAGEMIERVGLAHAVDRPIGKFSKGMMQRIGLAQALLHDPELLVLDEPMSGLDPIGRKEVRDLIVEERARGKTVLFTSHILTDVERLCDRIGIMHQGRMSHYGALSELLAGEADRSELELAGASEELRAELEQGGCGVSEQRGHLLVVVKGPPEPALRKAIEAGARVVSVTPAKETLEALFLRDALGGPEP